MKNLISYITLFFCASFVYAQAPDTTYLNPYDLLSDKTRLDWFMEHPHMCSTQVCIYIVRLDTFRIVANISREPEVVLANLASGRQCLLAQNLSICRDEFPHTLDPTAEPFESPFFTFFYVWNLLIQ